LVELIVVTIDGRVPGATFDRWKRWLGKLPWPRFGLPVSPASRKLGTVFCSEWTPPVVGIARAQMRFWTS